MHRNKRVRKFEKPLVQFKSLVPLWKDTEWVNTSPSVYKQQFTKDWVEKSAKIPAHILSNPLEESQADSDSTGDFESSEVSEDFSLPNSVDHVSDKGQGQPQVNDDLSMLEYNAKKNNQEIIYDVHAPFHTAQDEDSSESDDENDEDSMTQVTQVNHNPGRKTTPTPPVIKRNILNKMKSIVEAVQKKSAARNAELERKRMARILKTRKIDPPKIRPMAMSMARTFRGPKSSTNDDADNFGVKPSKKVKVKRSLRREKPKMKQPGGLVTVPQSTLKAMRSTVADEWRVQLRLRKETIARHEESQKRMNFKPSQMKKKVKNMTSEESLNKERKVKKFRKSKKVVPVEEISFKNINSESQSLIFNSKISATVPSKVTTFLPINEKEPETPGQNEVTVTMPEPEPVPAPIQNQPIKKYYGKLPQNLRPKDVILIKNKPEIKLYLQNLNKADLTFAEGQSPSVDPKEEVKDDTQVPTELYSPFEQLSVPGDLDIQDKVDVKINNLGQVNAHGEEDHVTNFLKKVKPSLAKNERLNWRNKPKPKHLYFESKIMPERNLTIFYKLPPLTKQEISLKIEHEENDPHDQLDDFSGHGSESDDSSMHRMKVSGKILQLESCDSILDPKSPYNSKEPSAVPTKTRIRVRGLKGK